MAVGRWQVAVLPLSLSLSILRNEQRKNEAWASFIREFSTEYAIEIFQKLWIFLPFNSGLKNFEVFLIFQRNIPSKIPSEPEFCQNIQNKFLFPPIQLRVKKILLQFFYFRTEFCRNPSENRSVRKSVRIRVNFSESVGDSEGLIFRRNKPSF